MSKLRYTNIGGMRVAPAGKKYSFSMYLTLPNGEFVNAYVFPNAKKSMPTQADYIVTVIDNPEEVITDKKTGEEKQNVSPWHSLPQ